MNVAARAAGLLLLLAVLLPAAIQGAELEQGINQAAIINFPTALNQPTTHMLHTTLELTDIVSVLPCLEKESMLNSVPCGSMVAM